MQLEPITNDNNSNVNQKTPHYCVLVQYSEKLHFLLKCNLQFLDMMLLEWEDTVFPHAYELIAL